jgi:exopolyphosphatase / guanosine-5'-triphosphate,3'-diphosphate pyrophosphatase
LTPGLFGSVASAPFAPAFAFFLFFLEMGSSVPVSPKRWSSIGRNISPGGAGLYHGWWKVSRPVVRYARRSALSRHSVIDVGSNTIHLLVGEVDGGEVLPVTGEKVSARLGAGVERKGRIEAERLELAAEAIGLFARIAALNGAPGPTILATSAVRDAENGEELTERVRELSGLKMRLISGEEEAALGFRGAVSAVGTSWEGPALVVDLGGGSAQLIVGEASSGPLMQVSLPLGSNRTTERFVEHDPPKKKQLRSLDEHVKKMMPGWGISQRVSVVAVGGSARAMLKITRDRLTVERMRELAREVSGQPSAVLAREHGLAPERARVMPAAITTLAAILEHFERDELTVARGGLREGTLLTLAEGKEI